MKTSRLIRPLSSAESYGGKANNLILLGELDLNIPQWVVIPQEVMAAQLSGLAPAIDIQEKLDMLTVPTQLLADMEAYFGPDYKEKKYAVRSSSMDEDGIAFSFAGQYETKLNVDFLQIKESIKAVWKSVASDHIIAYRKKNGLKMDFGIAVIIQEMIQSEVSGVAFGLDPLTGSKDKKVIAAVHGLGEGLVSGQLNADNFTVSKNGIEQNLAKDNGDNYLGTKANKVTLEESQVIELSELLDALNEKTGAPQDLEFAYLDNQLYVLQTRPITTVIKSDDQEYNLWDNSNIVESYPGITTPLTYSFISKMYTSVYVQLCGLLGVSGKKVNKHIDVFENTLGLVRGRVYYNLVNWYKMLAMAPGYSINAEFMETMMGVKEKFELGTEFRMSKSTAWIRIIIMIFKMIWLQVKLPKATIKFQTYLDEKLNVYNGYDYSTMPITTIISKYRVFEKTLLKEWKVPLVNDFFSMIWFGLLKKQVAKLVPKQPNLHNDLLCGSEDIISVQPIHRTMDLANMITADKEINALFSECTSEAIWNTLEQGFYSEIKLAIDQYLNDFGERCIGELKLETTSYNQDPTLFIKILKSYVINKVSNNRMNYKPDNNQRQSAEEAIQEALQGKPFSKLWFKIVLAKARQLVSNRENLRYERTRAFGVVRKMFSAIGVQLKQQKLIDNKKDIFYLKLPEVLELANQNNKQLVNQIRIRKAEFGAYELQPAPQERFYTYGTSFEDRFIYSSEKIVPIKGDLKGIGCCPGQVRAKVQVIEDPLSIDSLNGDILVTKSTDPGWVTLFPTASAIIVERGSLLSHSAIVSREMGIPCIVSVDGLLRTLKTGDEVLMDGSTGTIKILNQKEVGL